MSGLNDIGVELGVTEGDERAANAWALLHEIEGMLDELVQSGRESSIDLRGIPMSPADRKVLEQVLGEGELTARITALGLSQVRETSIHGVWWVTHYNTEDQVIAEFLEVSSCPDILRSHTDDIRDTLENLRTRLAQHQ